MGFYSFFRYILTIIIFSSLNVLAQSEAKNDSFDASYFAQSLTENIYNDTIKVSYYEGAVILAEIGDRWSKLSSTEASIWFDRAINSVDALPSNTSEEQAKKNQIIRELIKLILPKDKKNGNRLLKRLPSQSELNTEQAKLINDVLIEVAISLVETNPNQAVALASVALDNDNPILEPLFVWKLNKKNSSLASVFFEKALLVAQKNNDIKFINTLVSTAFPERFGMPVSGLAKSTKSKLLSYIWLNFQREIAEITRNKSGDCRIQASVVSSILPQFSEIMPEYLQQIKNAINFCQGTASEEIKNYNANENQPKTVEEFISAAEKAEDKDLKTEYFIEGAKLAFKEKNYKLAIKVLDLAKESLPNSLTSLWEEWRHDWAAFLIVDQIKTNNQIEALQTLKNVPDNLKPLTQIDVVHKFKSGEFPEIAFDFLTDARINILKIKMDSAEKAYNLSQIAQLFAQYQMLESSIEAYRDSVRLINYAVKERTEKNKNGNIDSGSELVGFVDFTTFPTKFIEENMLAFRELTNNIDSPLLKAKTKLSLLTVALNRLEREVKIKNSTKKITSKH